MRVELPYAQPVMLHAPSVPPQSTPPGPWIIALAHLINENALKVWFMLAMAAGAIAWLALSLFGSLVFTSTGGYVLIGLCGLFALSRLWLTLLVLGGFGALALLDQSISGVSAFLAQWWPLAIALAAVGSLALIVEAVFFRR